MSDDVPPPPVTTAKPPDHSATGSLRDPARANLRTFLEKLARRRKTIICSAKCHKTIENTLKKLGGKGLATTGRIRLDDLKEMLREPPAGVPPQTLREFVDIATAYDVGDGSVELQEVLKFALQSEPGILQRMTWILPFLVLVVWLLLGPAVFCPTEGWSYLDGLYLSALSLTSVGTSGGLSEGSQVYPRSQAAEVFLLIYVLIGTVLTIWFLLSLSLSMLWPHDQRPSVASLRGTPDLLAEDGHGTIKGGLPLEELVGDHPAKLPPKCEAVEHPSDIEKGPHGPLREGTAKPKSILQIHRESMREWARPRAKTLGAVAFWGSIFLEILVILAAGIALVLLTSTNASFLDAFSWAVLTGLTIGYDFMTPLGNAVNQNVARGLQIVYVLLSVLGILHMTFKIGRRCLRQRAEAFENLKKERILPADLLADLDKTGAGVNRLEFLCAALLTSDRVSGHDLSLALEMFQRLDPNGSGLLRTPQLEALQRSKTPATLSELLESPQLHSQLEAMQFPARKSMVDERTTAVLQEVYKDYNAVRRSLDAKDEELVQALKDHSASEQARARAVAQSEAMRKEVTLLSQSKTDLLQRVDKEARQNKEAQAAVEELKSRNRALEQKLKGLQLEQDEANNRLTTATRQLKEVQHLNHEYHRRAQEAEREIQDFPRRLKEQAECLQHEADIRVNQVRLEAAEQNLERQGEMQSAQLELKALSSSMEAMRGQLKQHSLSPSSPEGPSVGMATAFDARPLRPGLQWDVWSRPAWNGDPNGLLSEGKVKTQLEFLDSQVRRQVEPLSSSALSGGM